MEINNITSLYEKDKDTLIDLVGYVGKYMINVENQTVFTLLRDRYLKFGIGCKGYKQLVLYDENKKRKTQLIHRIFYQSFHKLNDETMLGNDIDHIDGDRLNNNIKNLRLCTRSQNMMNTIKWKGKKRFKKLV